MREKNSNENRKITGYPSIDRPWLKYYSEEAINASLPECTIYEYLWENNKDNLDDVALICRDNIIKYEELFVNIEMVAKALISKGVRKNDIVTVSMPSIPEAVYSVYAINRIGAIVNMIHPLAGENEICHYLNEVRSKVILMFEGTYQIIYKAIDRTSVECAVVVSSNQIMFSHIAFIGWKQFIEDGKDITLEEVKKDCHCGALISHTGGTTGTPKGVLMTDYNVNAEIWQIGCNLPHQRQEIVLVVLPPFINYSLVNAILEPLAFGFNVVLVPDYNPDKFDEYINEYHPNHINSIPPYWEALLYIPNIRKTDLSCLKHIYYGGDGLNEQTEEKINDLLLAQGAQYKLAKGLGSTEMVSASTIAYPECNVIGSAGIPLVKNICKIVDPETYKELVYGEEGEICFAGPTLMKEYYKNEEATKEIIKVHEDNRRWIHTGDLGYMTEDGILFVCGRIKRIIMTRGTDGLVTKVFPDRIEKVISGHPSVSQCCVIGVPDIQRIHYPKVFVTLNEERPVKEQLTLEIMELCSRLLPAYMIPNEVIYLSELPKTVRGKTDYSALEDMAKLGN